MELNSIHLQKKKKSIYSEGKVSSNDWEMKGKALVAATAYSSWVRYLTIHELNMKGIPLDKNCVAKSPKRNSTKKIRKGKADKTQLTERYNYK